MLRRLATWILLIPLLSNGLWMLCADEGKAPAPAPQRAAAATENPKCKTMCPLEKPVETGAICLISADGDGRSIAVFAFALAIPPAVESLVAPATFSYRTPEQTAKYRSPAPFHLTPPPKA